MTVLVCTDFSAASAAGEREAARRFPHAVLVVFHAVETRLLARVLDLTGTDGARLHDSLLDHADHRLNEVVERLARQGHRTVAELVEGDPVELALEAARRHDAELVVIGVKPNVDLGRFRTRMARRAPVPVLLVPGEE